MAIIGLVLATTSGDPVQAQMLEQTMSRPDDRVVFYAAIGPVLVHYEVNFDSGVLAKQGSVTLPNSVQYAWPHPSKRFLYTAWSDQSRGGPHGITAFRVDQASGAMSPHGQPVSLPWRPVHVTVDVPGTHVLVAYNNPSGASVHRIEVDGTLGAEVKPPAPLDVGTYAHQIRVCPSNRAVILVARGNAPTGNRPEDPGALKVFGYKNGVLTNRASIAPGGGYGFQPRHVDFHPSQPWVFLAVEQQNKLELYRKVDGEALANEPSFTKHTLDEPGNVRPGQVVGPIHVHPNGRFVYVGNRSSATTEFEGTRVAVGGENTIAVFSIDEETGEPTLIQNVDTRGFHPRTFAIDPNGRLLVVANAVTMSVLDGYDVRTIPASLAVFRVRTDGTLDFVRKYDVEAGRGAPFWVGFLCCPEG